MNRVFADTVFWVARINPRDQWHAAYKAVGSLRIATSDEVLDEVLAHFSEFGPAMRPRATPILRRVLHHPVRAPSGPRRRARIGARPRKCGLILRPSPAISAP